MELAVQARALGKRYGRNWALQDCDLEVPAGRIAALVGPNGAGKTTLLHLAVGLLKPDSGEVRVFGRAPRSVLADIGFVAQDAPLYRDFTAAELVAMGGKLNRARWDTALARDRLAGLGIPPDQPVGKLSGGQRAQVALALALAKRPRLLLLDEPIASLDPLARREFMQTLMGAVAESETTVLLSSHLLADLERSCDHLILLQRSRVQLAGPVDELLGSHRTLVGPRAGSDAVAGVEQVVRASHTERQSTLLVRRGDDPIDPLWTQHEVTLEDVVLAYLADAGTRVPASAWEVPA
ncbi:ABC transporter ATP-binding protein [Amycolatopsis sp. A133]|uniref:ABC transporter ATP-binding protein n=1 Tax=Amycolatopsis sp. A133 TaxID=3064472 RepID=UPI0027F3E3D0|nr:ABC transporter ATP-binding protein [Amycolatopsis sp. A133]MDQ7802773.1 ABC transporter ATP-binding protein [Amycolatopsis sp. A133]